MNDLTINIEQPSDGFKISSKLINDMQESRSRSPRQRQVSAAQLDDQQANAKSITIVYLNAETTLQELQQEKSVSSAEQPAATSAEEMQISKRPKKEEAHAGEISRQQQEQCDEAEPPQEWTKGKIFTGFEFQVPEPPLGLCWQPGDVQGQYILVSDDDSE